ncbi:MAG TPA: AP2 domain-containing protein [Cyanobacteria bacterium UBA9971]|nr:AP2 domain-containing protein [Cyanobacteria bacterium UBA9971]HCR36143.1 AP2 domain-containing protein [Candidatus Woesebacteria bacterium]
MTIKHGMCKTKEYYTWRNIINRCLYKDGINYPDYGGKGITICDEWKNSFMKFVNDVGLCPDDKSSLDRIENTKGYYKENCRWATCSEQAMNRGPKKDGIVKFKGVVYEPKKKLYRARIMSNGKTKSLGRRKTAEEAAKLYDKAAEELFGEFVLTNKKLGLL